MSELDELRKENSAFFERWKANADKANELRSLLKEAIEALDRVEEVTTNPGMEDPFNDGWRWRYKSQDTLTKLKEAVKE